MNKLFQITAFIFLSSLLYGQPGSPLQIQSGATIQPENFNVDVKRSTKLGDGIGTDTFSVHGVDYFFWDSAGYSITQGHNVLAWAGVAIPHYGVFVFDSAMNMMNYVVISATGTGCGRIKDDIYRTMQLTETDAALKLDFNDSTSGIVGIWHEGIAQYWETVLQQNGEDVCGLQGELHGDGDGHPSIRIFLKNDNDSIDHTRLHAHGELRFDNDIGFYFDSDTFGNFIIEADTMRIMNLGAAGVVVADAEGNLSAGSVSGWIIDGDDNMYAGTGALSSCTNCNENFVAGVQAGSLFEEGNRNTLVGNQANLVANASNVVGIGYNVNMAGDSCIIMGSLAQGDANSIVIGTISNGFARSIVLGHNLASSAENQFVVGTISESYFGNGVTNATPLNTRVNATGGFGTNITGASLTNAAGKGTGNAPSGDSKVQTSVPVASGTTLQTLGDRQAVLGRYTTLTETSATAFARVNIPTSTVAGGEVIITVEANDATDFQARTLSFLWSAENKAGTTIIGLSTPVEAIAVSAGTLTCTITATDAGSGNVDFNADCTSSLTQTTLRANAQVVKNFGTGSISSQ